MLKLAHQINLIIIQRVQNSRNPDVNKPFLVSSTIYIDDYVTNDVYMCAVCLEREERKLHYDNDSRLHNYNWSLWEGCS